jgi:hypothetical protein
LCFRTPCLFDSEICKVLQGRPLVGPTVTRIVACLTLPHSFADNHVDTLYACPAGSFTSFPQSPQSGGPATAAPARAASVLRQDGDLLPLRLIGGRSRVLHSPLVLAAHLHSINSPHPSACARGFESSRGPRGSHGELLLGSRIAPATDPESVYTQRPVDPAAYYFDSDAYGGGAVDATAALQAAVNRVKAERNYGILFIPEGIYRISGTLHVPPAIRLIGYGARRPEFVLSAASPGYQDAEDEKYMVWFTGNLVTSDSPPRDASPGTFYSAVSNIDFRIEDGNPGAVGLRTHYAQHSFVSHSVIRIGSGKAGISEVGNELENVEFWGGDYGIVTGPTSPNWPMMMVDTYFEGQRRAAIRSHNSGLTMVGLHARNGGTDVKSDGDAYLVREFTHGLVVPDLASDSAFAETYDIGRTSTLAAAGLGRPTFASGDIGKRTVQMDVGPGARLSNLKEVLAGGETSHVVDPDGNLYVADGQVFVYDSDLKETERINLTERPISIAFGGAEGDILFITTVESLYAVRVR